MGREGATGIEGTGESFRRVGGGAGGVYDLRFYDCDVFMI